MRKVARSKGVILVTKPPKSEEKQAILRREVALIHANAVIRRISAENVDQETKRRMVKELLEQTDKAQER